MRVGAIAMMLVARVAAADDPIDLPLAHEPVDVIRDHLAIRPLAHSDVDAEHGATRFVMLAEPTSLFDGPDLVDQIRRTLVGEPVRVARATVEPFGVTSEVTALAVVPSTPAGTGELVFAAYVAVGRSGLVDRLAFYVEDGNVTRDPSWRAVAHRIVRTAVQPAGFVTSRLRSWVIDVPRDARIHEGGFDVRSARCEVLEPCDAGPVAG